MRIWDLIRVRGQVEMKVCMWIVDITVKLLMIFLISFKLIKNSLERPYIWTCFWEKKNCGYLIMALVRTKLIFFFSKKDYRKTYMMLWDYVFLLEQLFFILVSVDTRRGSFCWKVEWKKWMCDIITFII